MRFDGDGLSVYHLTFRIQQLHVYMTTEFDAAVAAPQQSTFDLHASFSLLNVNLFWRGQPRLDRFDRGRVQWVNGLVSLAGKRCAEGKSQQGGDCKTMFHHNSP